ncbi:MAG TPA: histidine kinase, partial [Acidimicrobiales bacterium]|nr:histidine kinase [Acidimicrobiales bacterium]
MVEGSAPVPNVAGLRRARAEHDAVRRWFSRATPLLLVLITLAAFKVRPRPGLTGRGLVISIALGGFIAGLLLARATMSRTSGTWALPALAAGCFALLVTSSVVLMTVQPNGPGSVGVLLGVLFVARRLPGRIGVPVSCLTFVVLAVVAGTTGEGTGVASLALIGGFVGMMFLANRLAEANEKAEQLLLELEQSRAAEARSAGLAERQRLAREMHDILAHSLSGLLLQLEGARMLAAADPGDPRLPPVIERAHHLARGGLDEARRAIATLRDDDLPGPERLAELAAQFEENHGIPCCFTVSGEERPLDPQVRLALYRVAQEALTNVTKHASPERVELRLVYEPAATRLVVEDFGVGVGDGDLAGAPLGGDVGEGGGYGLT